MLLGTPQTSVFSITPLTPLTPKGSIFGPPTDGHHLKELESERFQNTSTGNPHTHPFPHGLVQKLIIRINTVEIPNKKTDGYYHLMIIFPYIPY